MVLGQHTTHTVRNPVMQPLKNFDLEARQHINNSNNPNKLEQAEMSKAYS